MTFKPEPIIAALEQNCGSFRNICDELPEEVVYYKPSPEKWSILEVVCHLLDEEREDFRPRLKHILDQNSGLMPPINPTLWVNERNYAAQNLSEMLENWDVERKKSVGWLLGLGTVDWEMYYLHPKLGKMTARLVLSNWLAHDYLHIRQITSLKFAYLQHLTGEDLSYAGTW